MVELEDIEAARERLAGQIAVTPCAGCVWLEPVTGVRSFLKLENLHSSGSFKERGALNRLLNLTAAESQAGVIAASAGNHAQAVALHAQRLGIKATIVMPEITPAIKVANTKHYGAHVILAGNDYDGAYAEARRRADSEGLTYVHAFDDPFVIAGQGTMGLEILEQVPNAGLIVVPVGGGGMIGGVAAAVKTKHPDVRVFGVETALVPSMKKALEMGAPTTVKGAHTLADGIAVRRVSEHTLALAKRYVDDIVLVTEEEIAAAVLFLVEREKTVAEGAGAAAVAALLAGRVHHVGNKPVVAVVGGGNIDVTMLGKIIDRGLVKDGRLVRLKLRIHDRPGGLAEVLLVIAQLRGNIVEVQHERAFTQTLYGDVEVYLTIETQGPEHIAELRERLDEVVKEIEEL